MDTSFKRAVLYGLAAGMRTTAPLVACASDERPWQWYLLLGEMVVDKLPWTPSRLQIGAWLGRIATAKFGAYQEFRRPEGCPWALLATAGGVAAITTKVAHDLRKALTHRVGLPDVVVAGLEDGLMLACVVRLRDREGMSDAA